MTAGTITDSTPADELLQATLEVCLSQALRQRVHVRAMARAPSPYATVFPAEIVSLTLADGRLLSLFVKHLGAEQADHPDKQRRDRECRVYETLLGDERLPVPRYYGSTRNADVARHTLVLEYVDAWNLKYQPLEHWATAATRLAELHAHFARDPQRLLDCESLLSFDADYFHAWAMRAVASVAAQSESLAAELHGVMRAYERATRLLAAQPPTLVHGDLAPKNVIADPSGTPARICFVDWEMAGIGCGMLDLVHLKFGLDPIHDEELCRLYSAALATTGLLPAHPAELRRLIAACELHKTLYRLARSRTWQLPLSTIAQWVADAHSFLERI